jgi:hypothetical protein
MTPELQRPIVGAGRHIEARIGQLLGPVPGQGRRTDLTSDRDLKLIDTHTASDFRLLAHGLNGKCTRPRWRSETQ